MIAVIDNATQQLIDDCAPEQLLLRPIDVSCIRMLYKQTRDSDRDGSMGSAEEIGLASRERDAIRRDREQRHALLRQVR